ncbi:MAG TPA: ABC transporter substrate-binding protein, partial [Ktedonobacteraceae bacterium]|nr:ABC transporter substrate-binding protein [Ktedonobacteraceae bacterium]
AGGQASFGERGQHSPWLTWEELQAADPEVLILSPCGFTLERLQVDLPLLRQHPAWKTLQAVQNGRVYAIDGNYYLNRSGPRLVESAELLASAIWGERLALSIDPHEVARIGA